MSLVNIASSTTTANVIGGSIMSTLVGNWTADLVIDQVDGTGFSGGTQVTITSENGYSRTGVIDPSRTGDRLDAVHVRVLGGAGGMLKPATARSFVQPGAFARDVVNGLVSDGGETLSTSTDAGFLTTNLTAWSVLGGNTIARNLKLLLQIVAPSMNWRILADGTLWIGSETWPASSVVYDVLDFDPAKGTYHIGAESPFIVPGISLAGVGNVSRVLDVIEAGTMHSTVWIDIPGGDRGVNYATQEMAKQGLPGVDYYALYLCQVASQSSDLTTVDLQPQGARNKALIGGLQRVPVRFMAGVKVQMAPGSTVLLGWDGGNPEVPFALGGFVGDSPLGIQLAGTHPAPLWDTFLSDFTTWVNNVTTVVISNSAAPGSPLVGAAAYSTAIAMPTSLVTKLAVLTNYQSQLVTNG